ncbi:MAG: hypothetical protein PHI97_28360 [Desulfobulbus sp.]|nr:hypothetical protein [Desulfobulbus sp.]
MKVRLSKLILFLLSLMPTFAFAEDWTPLVTSSTFDGIKADVLAACGSIFVIGLIIYGISILIRTVSR